MPPLPIDNAQKLVFNGQTIPIPNVDLPSFLLDGVRDYTDTSLDGKFMQPCLISADNPDKGLSLSNLNLFVRCFAAGLQRVGLEEGDHVMVVSPNYLTIVIVYLGTIAAGGVFCVSGLDFSFEEHQDLFRRAEPKFLLLGDVDPMKTRVLATWHSRNGDPKRVWILDEGFVTRDVAGKKTAGTLPSWSDLLDKRKGPKFQWKQFKTQEECGRPCQLIFADGIARPGAIAFLSHRDILALCVITTAERQSHLNNGPRRHTTTTVAEPFRILHTAPVASSFGTHIPLLLMESRRNLFAVLYFMSNIEGDAEPFLERLEKLKINCLTCADSTLIKMFANHNTKDDHVYDLSSLQTISVAEELCHRSTLDEARRFLGHHGAPTHLAISSVIGINEEDPITQMGI
jgi:acyl-CoA synthetase (AMP-forming)/AMP-acid ligase II